MWHREMEENDNSFYSFNVFNYPNNEQEYCYIGEVRTNTGLCSLNIFLMMDGSISFFINLPTLNILLPSDKEILTAMDADIFLAPDGTPTIQITIPDGIFWNFDGISILELPTFMNKLVSLLNEWSRRIFILLNFAAKMGTC